MTTVYERLAAPLTDQMVAAELDELRDWLKDLYPHLDTNDPVITSVWLAPLAQRIADHRRLVASVEQYGRLSSNVLHEIASETDRDELRAQLADSLSLEQIPAARAVGEVTIELSSETSVVIPGDTGFSTGSLRYVTPAAYILRSAAQQTGNTSERLLRPSGRGSWVATVPLVALGAGQASNVAQGSSFTSELDIPSLRSIVASEQFLGGRDANTLQDLIDSFFNGFAARTLGTRDQVVAFLRVQPAVGPVRQAGVIGFGDPEMQRDKLDFFPLGGGKADIYLASQQHPTNHSVTLEATVESVTTDRTALLIGIGRDVSPGYLRVLSVTDNLTGLALTVETETRGLDLTPIEGELLPSLSTNHPGQGSFSRFQTATLICSTAGGLSASKGDLRTVTVQFQRVPGLDIAQSTVASRTSRFVTGDTLVRSAIPIFLKVFVRLRTSFDTALPDLEVIRAAIADEIARRPMRPAVYQSDIVQAIDAYLPDDIAVERIDFEGVLVRPSGQQDKLVSQNTFEVPVWPFDQISPRTVAIYCVTSDVLISADQLLSYETP